MIRKIKVFLVEDEVIIRSGVKKSINWEQEGYEFVGEASDGELAYPMILKEKPDILITDIRMPFMDGLELSRLVKKELPDIKILILSGYDEFEYAKKAIKIGVTEYLLKPISAAKLTEVLNAVAETIRQENEEKNLLETYFAEMRENTERDKMRLFEKLLMGDLSMGEILEAGERFGMNLGASCYKIVLFKILANLENHVYAEQMVDACSSVEQAASMMEGVYVFQRGVEGWAFLLTAQDEKSMEESAKILYQNLKQAMKNYTQLEYFGGIGSTVPRIRSLKQSFREADRAFAARFVEETNQIISQKEFEKSQMEEGLKMQGVVQIGKSREMLQKFLSNGTREEVKAFSDAYISRIEEENIRSTMVRQYVVIDVCIVILSFCERISSANRLQE